jgi:hypothetical protein
MTQYDLYRDLARALYALALDAVQSHDVDRLAIVQSIARAALKPLREELGGHAPILGILEFLTPPKAINDDWWSFSRDSLDGLKEIYPEVLV